MKILRAIYYRTIFVFVSVRRVFDVFLMMVCLHFCPEYTYLFSSRKALPPPDKRYTVDERPKVPYEIFYSRTNYRRIYDEVNLVLKGKSFDVNKVNEFKHPTYMVTFNEPVKLDKWVIYTQSDSGMAKKFRSLGAPVLFIEPNNIREDNTIDQIDRYEKSARISRTYNFHKKANQVYVHPGSGLGTIGVFLNISEKLNIYGWDFYLNKSPNDMGYWELFFNLYKLIPDITRSRNHFESAMVNFYYGYLFSKMPNVSIHGRMGELGKHKKLIDKIERSLFIRR